MKSEIVYNENKGFKPVSVNLTFETKEELAVMLVLVSAGYSGYLSYPMKQRINSLLCGTEQARNNIVAHMDDAQIDRIAGNLLDGEVFNELNELLK